MSKIAEFKIGTVLASLLREHGLNLRQLSEATGVPQSTLNHWMENSTPRSPADAKKVAQFFRISLHYLFFGMEDENGSDPANGKDKLDGLALVAVKELTDEWCKCRLELTDVNGKKYCFEGLFVNEKDKLK